MGSTTRGPTPVDRSLATNRTRYRVGVETIAGTGIRVLNVASAYEHSGYSPDEIVDFYPVLTLTDVHMALAYYYENIEEFRSAMAERDEETEAPA